MNGGGAMNASGFEFTRRLDVSHASPGVAKLLAADFEAKSSHDAEGTADYYGNPATAHVDVPLGWAFDGWDSVYSMFSTYMPQWPSEVISAPTRIVGGDRGAVVSSRILLVCSATPRSSPSAW